MTDYDRWRTRCREHEEDDVEARDIKFYAGYRTEIDEVIADLARLSSAADDYEVNDPFGPALEYVKDWLGGVAIEGK